MTRARVTRVRGRWNGWEKGDVSKLRAREIQKRRRNEQTGTCILWPNGDVKVFTFSGPRGTINSEIGYVSIGLSKERLRYVKVWYLIDGNIFVLACIHDTLFASILSFARGLRKLIREIVSVSSRTFMKLKLI